MHYIIYKTTNLINGKFYIGKHQTKDLNDGYIGSGKLLKHAIKKYGLDNFRTEIVEACPTEAHMNLAEKIYVVIDKEVSYNLCPGGRGGFGYLNENGLNKSAKQKKHASILARKNLAKINSPDFLEIKRASIKKAHQRSMLNNPQGTFFGKKHTDETKRKMRESSVGKQSGIKNSQHGTCWMTNGTNTIKIKKEDIDNWTSIGYYNGR